MQRLALQNGQFWSKIKILKKHAKNDFRTTSWLSCEKKRFPKTAIIKKKNYKFSKIGKIDRYAQPLPNGQFGSKIKLLKSMPKTTLEARYRFLFKERLQTTANTRKMGRF